MADLCTVADVRTYLDESGGADDALYATLVARASELIRGYTGHTFTAVTETRTYPYAWGGSLPTGHMLAVTAVTVGGAQLPTDAYIRDAGRLLLTRDDGYSWAAATMASVTGTFGRYDYPSVDAVPADLRHVAAVTAARLYKMRAEGWQTRGGNAEMGETYHASLWTRDERAVLDRYKGQASRAYAVRVA
jgi:hypothetical protein